MTALDGKSPTVTSGRHRGTEISVVSQWITLTRRLVTHMVRNRDLLIALVAPAIFAVGFYLPLRFVMRLQNIDYAQFVLPIIALQAMAFTALASANRSAFEEISGINTRFRTMPIARGVPLLARWSAAFVRSVVSLAAAIVYGYIIGFRFTSGVWGAIGFVLISLAVGSALALGGDAIGVLSRSPEASSQALTLPTLVLGMFSTGFVPESGFPESVQPIVRNQPISIFATAMRDSASGHLTFDTALPAVLWILGITAVLVPLSIWASSRKG